MKNPKKDSEKKTLAKKEPKKKVVQGVNLEKTKEKSALDFVNGAPKKAFADMSDTLFDVKLETAPFEELMRIAVKMNIVPCADMRRLKQLIRAKREKQKGSEAEHTNKVVSFTPPSKDMQKKVDEILGKSAKNDGK